MSSRDERTSSPLPLGGDSKRAWLLAGAVGVLIVTSLMAYRWWVILERRAEAGGAAPTRVLVLPIAGGENREAAARAGLMTREVARRLGEEAEVRVVSGAVLPHLAEAAADPRRVGRELEAAFVLGGELRELGPGRVAARFELIEVAGGEVLWSESFERDAAGLAALAGEVARRAGRAITTETAAAR